MRVLGLVVLERGAARVVVVDAPGRKLGLEEVSDSRLLGDVEGKAVHAERRQHAHELVQLISVESSLEEEGGKASTNARGRRCRIHVVVATTIIRAREAIGARRDAHLALGLFEVRLETGENLRTEIIVRALHGEDRAFRARARLPRDPRRNRLRIRSRRGKRLTRATSAISVGGNPTVSSAAPCGRLTVQPARNPSVATPGVSKDRERLAGMARGMQKAISKERAAAKKANGPQQGKSQLGEARAKGMKAPCPICKMPLVDYFQLKQHYESKHPKESVPPLP